MPIQDLITLTVLRVIVVIPVIVAVVGFGMMVWGVGNSSRFDER